MASCQCSYCLNPEEFVWLDGDKLMPSGAPSFKYPIYVRMRVGKCNVLAIMEAANRIRFDDKVKTSWASATTHAYNKAGRFGPEGKNAKDPDKWLPNGWDPKRLWSMNIMGFGSVTLDGIDIVNAISSSGKKRHELSAVACTDFGRSNYEIANNILCNFDKTLKMFEKTTRAEIQKNRPVLVATQQTYCASAPAKSEVECTEVKRAPPRPQAKRQKSHQVAEDVQMAVVDEDDIEEFAWTIHAPAVEWTSVNISKYLERNDTYVPPLHAIDRVFKRYGVQTEFMDVRMIHPVTSEEIKVTLSSTVLFHTPVYKKHIEEALREYRAQH